MASSVFNVASSQPTAYAPAQPKTQTTTPPVTQPVTPPQPAQDTVKLSESAQVSLLSEEGQTAQEISQALKVPLATVNSDLGIIASATATSAAVVVAASTDKSAA